jgi:hypothetical protein
MPIRAYTFKDENSVARFLSERGISHHEVGGPYYNMNGAQYVLVDEGMPQNLPPSGIPVIGMSYGVSDGGSPNIAEVTNAYTSVTAESLGPATLSFSATLANTVVIPSTVVVTLTSSTTILKDNGRGRLLSTIDASPRGTINYYTGAVSITFWGQDNIGGNVEVDYQYSSLPTATGIPDKVELVGLMIDSGTASATITATVYNDNSGASAAFTGSVTLDTDGKGFLPLSGAISIALDPTVPSRWVVLSGADTYGVSLQWRRADI